MKTKLDKFNTIIHHEKHIFLQFKISKEIKESSRRIIPNTKIYRSSSDSFSGKRLLPTIIPPFFNLQHSFSTILSNPQLTLPSILSITSLKRACDEPYQQQAGKNPRRRRKGEAEVGFRRKESTPGLRRIDNAVCIKQSFYRRRRDHSPPLYPPPHGYRRPTLFQPAGTYL